MLGEWGEVICVVDLEDNYREKLKTYSMEYILHEKYIPK